MDRDKDDVFGKIDLKSGPFKNRYYLIKDRGTDVIVVAYAFMQDPTYTELTFIQDIGKKENYPAQQKENTFPVCIGYGK